jgi:predicted ATPase
MPEAVSELIGRDARLREVVDAVTSHRLVTLTGAGGVGKTRLAVEVARSCCRGLPTAQRWPS